MSWNVRATVLDKRHYVDVTFSSYTEDTSMTPHAARALAKQINAMADRVEVANRPPVKPFWK